MQQVRHEEAEQGVIAPARDAAQQNALVDEGGPLADARREETRLGIRSAGVSPAQESSVKSWRIWHFVIARARHEDESFGCIARRCEVQALACSNPHVGYPMRTQMNGTADSGLKRRTR